MSCPTAELFVYYLLPPVFTLTMFKQLLLLSAALLALLAVPTFGAFLPSLSPPHRFPPFIFDLPNTCCERGRSVSILQPSTMWTNPIMVHLLRKGV
jgi:hypothetical protein